MPQFHMVIVNSTFPRLHMVAHELPRVGENVELPEEKVEGHKLYKTRRIRQVLHVVIPVVAYGEAAGIDIPVITVNDE